MQTITLGGGCFWCTEATFQSVKGISEIICGYIGGSKETANYKTICTGTTKHVEVIQVTFDETVIDVNTVLKIFFTIHDPTTLNRQGHDVGTQYASAVFYHDVEQKAITVSIIEELKTTGLDIVTRVEPATDFYNAEDYHQDYYTKNPEQAYCNAVIPPKLAKLRREYRDYFIA